MKTNTNHRYRNLCFTCFDEEEPTFNADEMGFLIYQREECPTTKRKHWQGYVEFKKQHRYNKCQELLNMQKVHFECRRGSQRQAIDYCKKKDTQISPHKLFGMPKSQGHRSDLDSIYDDIENGMTVREILRAHEGQAVRNINNILRAVEAMNTIIPIDRHILIARGVLDINGNIIEREEGEE